MSIRLRVTGERGRAVELVRNLEKSKRFLSPRLSNESLQASQQGTSASAQALAGVPGGVQFDILSGYNPLSAAETKQMEAVARSRTKVASGNDQSVSAKKRASTPVRHTAPPARIPKGGPR